MVYFRSVDFIVVSMHANVKFQVFVIVVDAVKVTPSELAEIMRGLGDKLSDDEINLLVKVADKDGDGTISIEE